jgi:hypothetical protein
VVFLWAHGRQRFGLANQQVSRSILAMHVAPRKYVEGEAILSARPFKKRQLVGVFLWALADSGLNLRTRRFNEAFQQRMLRNKNA